MGANYFWHVRFKGGSHWDYEVAAMEYGKKRLYVLHGFVISIFMLNFAAPFNVFVSL